MADEREDTCIDECVDNLSDIPLDSDDSIILEDNPDCAEFSSGSEIEVRRNHRTLPLPSDSEESDQDTEDVWSDFDPPKNNDDFEGLLGPNVFPKNTDKIEDFADMFIGDDLFKFIATETNKYHAQNSHKFKVYKKTAKWVDVTILELKKWFALVILMGLTKKSRINDYWSKNPLIETPIFSKTMTRNRFKQILAFIHFSDNNNVPDNADRLFKIQHIINYFSKKFQENLKPGQNISIDEGMIPWRGRLNFRVYNPSKITKYGILIRMLCDSTTGYISSFKLYSGAGQSLNTTILELLAHSLGKWHHLYMDNFYNSVELSKILLLNKIRVCETIRRNRGLPDSLKKTKLKVFETAFKRKGEILLQLWKTAKSKDIRMISTIHNAEIVYTGKICRKTNSPIQKPKCIIDYNHHMKGVDRADQYLSYYPIYRKTIKWSKKVVLYLFNCALFNAFRVYEHLNVKSTKTLKFHDFLLQLSDAWIQGNLSDNEENLDMPTTSRGPHHDSTQNLVT